jgi:hypothetical protein
VAVCQSTLLITVSSLQVSLLLYHINLRTMAAAFNPYGSHIHDDEDSRDDNGPQRNVRESGTPESKRSGFSFMDTTHSFFQRMGSPFSRASKRSQWDDYDSGEEWEEEEEREEAPPSPPRPKRDLSRVRSVRPSKKSSIEETIPVAPMVSSSSQGFIDPWESPEPKLKSVRHRYVIVIGYV